jgi:hypothetical protein
MSTALPSRTDSRYGQRSGVRWNIRMRKTAGIRAQGTGATVHGRAVNVSRSGILFQSSVSYQPGDTLDMEILLNERASVRCLVRIRRVRPALTTASAYGAEFVRFYNDGHRVYNDYVQRLRRREISESELARSVSGVQDERSPANARNGRYFLHKLFSR